MAPLTVQIFLLTAEARSDENGSFMLLFGSSDLGPVAVRCSYQPYYYIAGQAALPLPVAQLLLPAERESPVVSLSSVPLRKLQFQSLSDADRARRMLADARLTLYESDVRPRERFLMDHGINGAMQVTGTAEERERLLYFENPAIAPATFTPKLRVCSLDIETSIASGSLLSIAVHLSGAAGDQRKVFMIGEPARDEGRLSFMPRERALMAAFLEWFLAADPDVIIGWNVIGFDLSFLKDRASALRLPFPLGRAGRSFTVSESAGGFSRAAVPGRVVLDGPQLLRTSFYSFESYSLENVSRQVLGEGKLIAATDNRAWEIEHLFKTDKQALAEYNLKDTLLVSGIFEKLGLLELTIRRTELSGMLLDQVGLSTASFDHFYLPRLHAAGYAAGDVGSAVEDGTAAGGYVMSPVAGLYENVLALDFRSLYPSIIRTFNIDPLARACAGLDPLMTPKGHKFSRTKAILPSFIANLMDERRAAKKSGNKPLSQAIKIMMNSLYGVMGSPGCRFYDPALPDAITSTGQWLLMESKRQLEEEGYRVIYGDTDSLFVLLHETAVDPPEEGRRLAARLTEWWRVRIDREFAVESHLHLEFKRHYPKFLLPAARAGEGGAKKRYAGLFLNHGAEQLEFVGLEVVRSDWTRLARDFQRDLYTRIFRAEPIDTWLREFVLRVRRGEFDDKLVYRKRLHKALNEYGTSPPPYVRAAMQLPKPTRHVSYVMTIKGPIPVQLAPQNPDYNHYVTHQLKPVADSILEVLGVSFDQIISAQLRLF